LAGSYTARFFATKAAINDERYDGGIRPETDISQEVFTGTKEKVETKRTVYPFIAKDFIPITAGDLCILTAQYEQTLVSRVCQDEAYPLLGEMRVSDLVWLLAVWRV
jgi:hypothetical protein